MKPPARRCAIYTRKSSDEGLDQSFNSLDAQREAGEAYVKSQASEGWRALPALYDDGGFSGGTMERPALKRLMSDIEAGLVNVVVVYKIDRLTRSLADFARIVERFDARGVSFVSVTQAFNTTSSMGRLTLNVLLSFAQFEREVTGERIRDKIAASKAKGMWMGGVPPLGYDLPAPGTRTLLVNEDEATTVRHIFARYLELGSVHRLQRELTEQHIVSKQRITASGKAVGGAPFSRGALFHLLRGRIYLGQIVHKQLVHEGAHAGIVDPALFDAVQRHLDDHARRHKAAPERKVVKAPLTGRLYDANGEVMSPTFSRGRSGRLYRYYVSTSLQQGGSARDDDVLRRVPAPAIEQLVGDALAQTVPHAAQPMEHVAAVRLRHGVLAIDLSGIAASRIRDHLTERETILGAGNTCTITLALALPLRGGRRSIEAGKPHGANPDPVLVAALRKAQAMLGRCERGLPTMVAAPVSPYHRRLLRLAFLAPSLQQAILAGRQPASLTLERLMTRPIPLAWCEQRAELGNTACSP